MFLSAFLFSFGMSAPVLAGVMPTPACLEVFPGVATPELPMRRAETWTLWAEETDNPVRFHRHAVKLYECAIEKAEALQKQKPSQAKKYADLQRKAEIALRQARVRVDNNWDTFRSQYPAVWWFLDTNSSIERYDGSEMAAIGQAWAGLIGGIEPLKIPRLAVLPRCSGVVEATPGQTREETCEQMRGEVLQLLSQNQRFQGLGDASVVEILGPDFEVLMTTRERGNPKEQELLQRLAAGLGLGEVMILDLNLSDRFHLPARHQWADVARVDLSYRIWSLRKGAWIADGRRSAVVADVRTGWWIGLFAVALLFMVSVLFNPTLQLLRKLKGHQQVAEKAKRSSPNRSKRALAAQFGIPLIAFGVGGLVGVMAGMVSEQLVPSWESPTLTPLHLPRVHVLWWPLVHGFVVMVVPTLVTVALIFRFLDESTRRRNQIQVSMGVIVTSAQGGALAALYWPMVTASWVVPAAFGLAFLSPLILSTFALLACFLLGGLISAAVDPNQANPMGRQVGALLLGIVFLSLLLPVGLFEGEGALGAIPRGLLGIFALAILFAPLGRWLSRSRVGRNWSQGAVATPSQLVQGSSLAWVETPLSRALYGQLQSVGLQPPDGVEPAKNHDFKSPDDWRLNDQQHVYLISGCYGDGKSRHVAELARRLQKQKVSFGVGKGTQALSAQPYGVLKQALKDLDLVDLDARRSSLERVQRIKEAAGEGLQALGTVGALLASPKDGGDSEASLASGLIDAMELRLSRGPVVLLIDDYQLADDNSKELLKRVVEGIRSELAHQLVVLLFEELPHGIETGDAGFLLDDKGARALISNANVKIDRERDTRRLLRQWQVSDTPHAYRSGYIVEGLRTLQDLSFLEPHRSGDGSLQLKPYLEDDHFERAQPQAVRARFEEQFAELSLEQQHVLLCGSLCGEVFSVKNVAEGLHRSPLDVLQLLRSIEEDYGLVDDDDDDTTFRFVSAQFRRHLEHIKLKKEPGLDESVDGEGQQRSKVAKERPWRELAKQMHYNIATALQKSLEELKENATGPLREPDSATSSLIAYHAHQAGERLFGLASVHLAWGVIQAADRSAWSMAKRKAERFSRRQQWGFIESRDQTRNEWEKELHDRVWPADLSGERKAELRFRLDLAIAQANSRHEGNRRILARALLRRLIQVIPSDRSQEMMHLRRRALILYLQISYAERQVSELEEIREDANQWLGGSQLTESETDVSMRSWFEGDAFANQVLRFFQIRSDAFLETRQCESSQRSERLEKSLESYAQLNFEVPEGRDSLVGHERHQWLWCQAELLVAEAETEFKLGQRETPGDYNSKRFENFEAKLKSALECQTESGNLVDAARNHLSRANLLIEKMRCIDSAGSEPEDDDRVQVQERRLELDQCLDAVDELIRKTGAEKLRSRLENLHALIFWDKDLRLQAFDAAFKAFDAACETYTARDIFYAGGNLLRFANAPGEERPDGLLEKLEQRIVDQEQEEEKEAQKKREDRQAQDAAQRSKRQGLFIMCEWSVWRELPDGDDLRQKFLCIEPSDGDGYQLNVAEPGYLSLEDLDPNRPYARFCRRVLAAQIRAYRGRGGQKNRERIRYLSNYLVDKTLGKANVAVDEYIYDAIRANLSETYEEKQVDELLGVLNTTQVWRQFLIELKHPDAMSDLCSEVVKLYATLALNFLQRDDGITPARHLYGRLLTVGEDLFAQWRAEDWGAFSGKEAVAPQDETTNRRHRRLLSRVLREAVLILERLDGEQDDWMIQVRSWLQSAVDNQHVSAERFGELSELQAEGLRSGLLLYAETIARSGAAPVAVAQIEIQRADQKIWQLQKRLESTVDDRERSMNETRALIDDAYRAYERAGDVLERHRYESFRSKLRNTFANIDWRKAMAQSEQDKLGRSTELLAAYDRAQRAYEMASDWNRERDLVYAAITLLRFRLDYLSHQKLVKEADRQEFDQRWLHTVQRLQEDERLGDQEAAEDRLTLASPSIWGEVMSNGDQLGKKLKSQLGKLEKGDHVDTTWCQKIRSAVDKGSDLDAMIETSPGASEAMAFWDKELVYE